MAVANNISSDSYKALLRRSTEPCDFCEREFKNRYDSIIHNASHIIIPLIKQNWNQCEVCLYYFRSQEDLYDHQKIKHKDVAIKTGKTNNEYHPKIEFENSDVINVNDTYNSVVKIEEDYDFSNTSKHLNVVRNIIKHENDTDCYMIVNRENYRHDLIQIKNEALKVDVPDVDNGIIDITGDDSNGNTESIKSRLRFEEDDSFDDDILSNLLTDCKANLFNEPINQTTRFKNLSPIKDINNVNNSYNGFNKKSFPIQNLISNIIKSKYFEKPVQNGETATNNVCNNPVTDDYEYDNYFLTNKPKVDHGNEAKTVVKNVHNINNISGEPECVYKSVHYTELAKPGIYSCKYCFKLYPNRLLLIQHETTHIHIKKPRPALCSYCDKYIAGNYVQLRKHIQEKHPGAPLDRKRNTHKCDKCGLKFSRYLSHVRNYHPYDCHGCGKEYTKATEKELEQHMNSCAHQSFHSKILFVCELCFSFFKVTMTMNLKYTLMGNTVNEPGVRHPCAVCGKKYFELKMIKRTTRLHGLQSGNVDTGCETRYHKAKKPLTNEERLKKFQHRLKKINLLNKFYFAVLFINIPTK